MSRLPILDDLLRLMEDGFILENNKWDHLPIDDLVISNALCHKPQRDKLEKEGYLG